MVTTSHADTRCVTPAALQPLIDAAVAAAPQPARSFVRASGTEDVVRVYAEAGTAEGARELCAAVKALVVKHCS
jgi:phosphoacetylglucosamine mutase